MTFVKKQHPTREEVIEIYRNFCEELGRPTATSTQLRERRRQDPNFPTIEEFLLHFGGKLQKLQEAAGVQQSERGRGIKYRHDQLLACYARLWIVLLFTRQQALAPGIRELNAVKRKSNGSFPGYMEFRKAFDWPDEFSDKAKLLILHWHNSGELRLPEELALALSRTKRMKKAVRAETLSKAERKEITVKRIAFWIYRHRRVPTEGELAAHAAHNPGFPGPDNLHPHFKNLDEALHAVRVLATANNLYRDVHEVFEASYSQG